MVAVGGVGGGVLTAATAASVTRVCASTPPSRPQTLRISCFNSAPPQRVVNGDALWPPLPDDCWGHCGSALGLFGKLTRFNAPLSARQGITPANIAHFLF